MTTLRPVQLAWLAAAVVVVSAGYGALLPVLPGWLASLLPGANASEVGRHVGFLSGVYAAGVLLGAPLWGIAADRVGRGRILIFGLVGYVASLLLLLVPALAALWGIYALRGATGFLSLRSSRWSQLWWRNTRLRRSGRDVSPGWAPCPCLDFCSGPHSVKWLAASGRG